MNKVTKIAGVLSLLLTTVNLQAISNDSCNFDLDFELEIENSAITLTNDEGLKIHINEDNQLFVNDGAKSLNSEQQALVDDYADGVRVLVPEVTALAIEGVNLGVRAAGMALGTLFGNDDPDFDLFTQKVTDIADLIIVKLDNSNFSTKELKMAFDEDFEHGIQSIVEEAVEELTPKLMAKIVTAAMSGDDGTISDLEMRAENLEQDIEAFVEPQAEALEARAEELCGSIENLNRIEDKMVDAGLEMMDIIVNGTHSHNKSKGKRFKFNLGD